jgi:hypothetical protein
MIPVFEWVKTVHALDCAAAVIGNIYGHDEIISYIACSIKFLK